MSTPAALYYFYLKVWYANNLYSVHFATPGSKYVTVEKKYDNLYYIGFEDLDESAGFTPDYDYLNPRIGVLFFYHYMLVWVDKIVCNLPVMYSQLYYKKTPLYLFLCPLDRSSYGYTVIDLYTGQVLAKGDYLRYILEARLFIPSWGVSLVRSGVPLDIYIMAESNGLQIIVRILKPDGTVEEKVAEDLGDGNYKVTVVPDKPGEYLVEAIYPDGFRRKKVFIAV